jgi:hypothetical protein
MTGKRKNVSTYDIFNDIFRTKNVKVSPSYENSEICVYAQVYNYLLKVYDSSFVLLHNGAQK